MADKQAIDIKGTTMSTLAFHLRTGALQELKSYLDKKFGRKATFFEGEPVVLDLEEVQEIDDFQELILLLRQLGFVPVAVKNAGASLAESAATMHLAVLESDSSAQPPEISKEKPSETGAADGVAPSKAAVIDAFEKITAEKVQPVSKPSEYKDAPKQQIKQEPAAEPTAKKTSPKPVELAMPGGGARIIRRPLRSGQQVYAQGRDLIALDLVSFGAEVISDGNVHVYAPLRGRALAGVKGDRHARIYTLNMQAELVAIAGVYRTFEEPIPLALQNRPVQIFLDEADKIVIEPIGR